MSFVLVMFNEPLGIGLAGMPTKEVAAAEVCEVPAILFERAPVCLDDDEAAAPLALAEELDVEVAE